MEKEPENKKYREGKDPPRMEKVRNSASWLWKQPATPENF